MAIVDDDDDELYAITRARKVVGFSLLFRAVVCCFRCYSVCCALVYSAFGFGRPVEECEESVMWMPELTADGDGYCEAPFVVHAVAMDNEINARVYYSI